jgi:hypothetical protein
MLMLAKGRTSCGLRRSLKRPWQSRPSRPSVTGGIKSPALVVEARANRYLQGKLNSIELYLEINPNDSKSRFIEEEFLVSRDSLGYHWILSKVNPYFGRYPWPFASGQRTDSKTPREGLP